MVPTNVSIGVRSKYCDVRCGRFPVVFTASGSNWWRETNLRNTSSEKVLSPSLFSHRVPVHLWCNTGAREREEKKETNKRDRRETLSTLIVFLSLFFILSLSLHSFSSSLTLSFDLKCADDWIKMKKSASWLTCLSYLVTYTEERKKREGEKRRKNLREKGRETRLWGDKIVTFIIQWYSCLHHQNDGDQGRESFESWKVELERERSIKERNRERESIWWWDEHCIIHIPILIFLLMIQSWQFFISLSIFLHFSLSLSLWVVIAPKVCKSLINMHN